MPFKKGGIRGVTLVELAFSVAALGIILLVVVPLMNKIIQGFTKTESRNSIHQDYQAALGSIRTEVANAKKVLDFTPASALLSKINLSAPPMLDTKLPAIQPLASLSPNDAAFSQASVGNSLIMITTEGTYLLVLSGGKSTYVDSYHISYYYLSYDESSQVGGAKRRNLMVWRSIPLVDCDQIFSLTTPAEQQTAGTLLYTKGFRYGWQPSKNPILQSFYSLASNGDLTPLTGTFAIPASAEKPAVTVLKGLTIMGGYRYGIAPNSSASSGNPVVVPKFTLVSGDFPSGFEVVMVGPSNNLQVLVRLVSAASGSFQGLVMDEQTMVVTAKN